ncbi:hypothetical protein SFR_4916 [Streptomyces sp. FR-008]|nr:hypothetical protein SFR_4916 [Streptomyces sp. FR-008]
MVGRVSATGRLTTAGDRGARTRTGRRRRPKPT